MWLAWLLARLPFGCVGSSPPLARAVLPCNSMFQPCKARVEMNQISGYLRYLAVSGHPRSPLDIYLDIPREDDQISGYQM